VSLLGSFSSSAHFLLPFGSFNIEKLAITVDMIRNAKLSTPFWEFLNQLAQTFRDYVMRAIPFYSLLGVSCHPWEKVHNMLKPVDITFYSLLGVSNKYPNRTIEEFLFKNLSTPFWEFL